MWLPSLLSWVSEGESALQLPFGFHCTDGEPSLPDECSGLLSLINVFVTSLFFTGRVVSPTPTPLFSGRVGAALFAFYDMHGRAVGLFYAEPTGQF